MQTEGQNNFDALTRHAADVTSRRTSLLALGGAALAIAASGARPAAAKKKNVKDKICKRQKNECREFIQTFCGDPGKNEEVCLENLLPCCEPFAQCQAAEGVACVLDAFSIHLEPIRRLRRV